MKEAAQQPGWRRFQAPQNQGRGFERFVAAIQKVEASGAQVVWNERINGRQFDVTIRKAVGQDTELTVIEARDYSKKPVGATDVEAFVTKARDAGAHKAAMVVPGRFTRGALRVAEKHGVELRTLKEFREEWPTRLVEERTVALNIRNVRFWGPSGERYTLPGVEEVVLPGTILQDSEGEKLPFPDACQRLGVSSGLKNGDGYREWELRLPGFSVYFPGESAKPVGVVVLEAGIIPAVKLSREPAPVNVPYRLRYEYSRVGGQEQRSFAEVDLPVGFDTVLTPGRFYRNTMGLTYKCLGIEGDQVRMVYLEPRSLPGDIKAIELTGPLSVARGQYVEIEDPEECWKLEEIAKKIPPKAAA